MFRVELPGNIGVLTTRWKRILLDLLPGRVKQELAEVLTGLRSALRKPCYGPKIFCIGFNKTGTTSLGMALKSLGFRHSSFNKRVWRRYYKAGDFTRIIAYTSKFDSFDDLPWLKEDIIPMMDKAFPNSRFIYLEREEAGWKQSYARWTKKMTGVDPDVDAAWADYLQHREFVLRYFQSRGANEFIVLKIDDPTGFKKLGEFVGRRAPADVFPHFNSASDVV